MIVHTMLKLRVALYAVAVILLQCGLGPSALAADPYTLSGRVLRVLGPNQLVVEGPAGAQYQVVLRGTTPAAGSHPAAHAAEQRLIETLVGRHVTITDIAGGTSSSVTGVVRFGNEDINYQWLRDGLLRFDGNTDDAGIIDAYTAAEEEARAVGLGIWAADDAPGTPTTPAVPATPPPGGWLFRPLGPSTGR